VPGLKLLAAIFGAPLAWMAQMSLSEPLAAQVCFPGSRPLTVPAWPSLQMALLAISGACLLAALASALAAWSVWRSTRGEVADGDDIGRDDGDGKGLAMGKTADSGVGRTGFLAVLGLMSSGLFVSAVLFTALAALLVAPCAGAA
jgi:hypothetical protein